MQAVDVKEDLLLVLTEHLEPYLISRDAYMMVCACLKLVESVGTPEVLEALESAGGRGHRNYEISNKTREQEQEILYKLFVHLEAYLVNLKKEVEKCGKVFQDESNTINPILKMIDEHRQNTEKQYSSLLTWLGDTNENTNGK